MKKFIYFLIGILVVSTTIYAAPTYIFQKTILPEITNTYDLGSASLVWRNLYVNQICLSGDCQSSWPAGGGISTSSAETNTYIPFWTSTNGTPALLSGGTSNLTWNGTNLFANYASTTQLTTTGSTYLATLGGNVGLGTTTPFAKLSVNSEAGEAAFVVGSSTRTSLIVDKNGNVGVGTNAPSTALSVAGTGTFTTSVVTPIVGGTASAVDIGYTGFMARFSNNGFYPITSSNLDLGFASGGFSWKSLQIVGRIGWDNAGTIDTGLARNAAGVIEINNGTAGQYRDIQLRAINPVSGNVGIGTMTPAKTLDIAGNLRISTDVTAGSGFFTINGGTGQVAATDFQANIYGNFVSGPNTAGYFGSRGGTYGNNGPQITVEGGNSAGGTDKNAGSLVLSGGSSTGLGTSYILFQTATPSVSGSDVNAVSTKMVLNSFGNVGIGTTSPRGLLHLSKTGTNDIITDDLSQTANNRRWDISNYLSTLRFWALNDNNSLANEAMAITRAGNVGIGSSTPNSKLVVSVGAGNTTNLLSVATSTANKVTLNVDQDGILNKKYGVFCGMYIADGVTAQSIPTGTTYTKSTALSTTDINTKYCTPSMANSNITITNPGVYKISGSFSFTSGTNNVTFRGTAFVDGVEQGKIHWGRKVSTGADMGSASFTGFIVATSSSVVDFRVRHTDAGSVDLTIVYGNLNVEYVGSNN